MTTVDVLEQGRAAYSKQRWAVAYELLAAADRETPLGPEDLERLSVAAMLTGQDSDLDAAATRAHNEFAARGELTRAARCAFWLGMTLLNRGEMAQGSGWLARAGRLLDDSGEDCVERGYLLIPAGIQQFYGGDGAAALALFQQAGQIAERYRDPDLAALSRFGSGQALVQLGRVTEGLTMLDEAMVAVTAGSVSPVPTGIVYCGVIDTCMGLFDLRRAQEWTAALTNWCESQPDMVPFRGQCLIHRAEILQLHGSWPDAMTEAARARDRLLQPVHPAVGAAYYRQAELHRLRGEYEAAEAAYREASQWGHEPQPGLALLRLAQGKVDAAVASIRRVLDERADPMLRPKLLFTQVEVALAAHDVAVARTATDELAEITAARDAPMLHAVSAYATGAVLLAEGDPRAALNVLRRAWLNWQELEAPYDAAHARVLMGQACRQLGDEDSAQLEFDAARWVFQQLGAAPDLAMVEALLHPVTAGAAGGLTARELQVLRLVATGKTNREIATDLFLSEKTVARHVSNIFTKLDLRSRAAATAYAYEHEIV